MFSQVPSGLAFAGVGFGFGLLTRSMGGGITLALALAFILDGIIGFIPGFENIGFGRLTHDLTSGLSGHGETANGLGAAILGSDRLGRDRHDSRAGCGSSAATSSNRTTPRLRERSPAGRPDEPASTSYASRAHRPVRPGAELARACLAGAVERRMLGVLLCATDESQVGLWGGASCAIIVGGRE